MAKRKRQPRAEVTEDYQEEYIDRKFRDFTIRVYPFPTGLFEKLSSQAESKFPYPGPPQKEIETLGENEIIDDIDDPIYQGQVRSVDEQRKNYAGTITFAALLESCLDVLEKDKMRAKIVRLQNIGIEFPEDEDESQQDFIVNYLVRTEGDYTTLVLDSIGMSVTGSEEVAERLNSFRHQMEGRVPSNSQSSSSEKEQVQSSD